MYLFVVIFEIRTGSITHETGRFRNGLWQNEWSLSKISPRLNWIATAPSCCSVTSLHSSLVHQMLTVLCLHIYLDKDDRHTSDPMKPPTERVVCRWSCEWKATVVVGTTSTQLARLQFHNRSTLHCLSATQEQNILNNRHTTWRWGSLHCFVCCTYVISICLGLTMRVMNKLERHHHSRIRRRGCGGHYYNRCCRRRSSHRSWATM